MIERLRAWVGVPSLVFAVLLLSLFGVAIIYSAGVLNEPSPVTQNIWQRQAAWLFLAIGAFTAITFIPLRWIEWAALPAYIAGFILLAATLVIGTGAGTAAGVKSFIVVMGIRFQPAEVAKLATILAVARFFADRREAVQNLRELVAPVAMVGLPLALVILQPDLGTALAFIGILFAMLYWGGTPVPLLILLASPGLAMILSYDTLVWSGYIILLTLSLFF